MHRKLNSILTHFSCILVFFLGSCKREFPAVNRSAPTIQDYISQNSRFSILQKAAEITGLFADSDYLKGLPVTFFAPINDAFLRAGITMDSLNLLLSTATASVRNQKKSALLRLLKNHVIRGSLSSLGLDGSSPLPVTTLNTGVQHSDYKPFLTKNFYGIFLNGSKVITPNMEVSDGYVQEIGRVAQIPDFNLYEAIKSRPDLTFTVAILDLDMFRLIKEAFLIDPGLVGFTVFPVSDSAWKAAGYTSVAEIQNTDPRFLLVDIFPTMIATGTRFSCDFLGGFDILPSAQQAYYHIFSAAGERNPIESAGFTYLISSDGTTIFQGLEKPTPKIIARDIPATNGVIHIVNTLPNSTGIN